MSAENTKGFRLQLVRRLMVSLKRFGPTSRKSLSDLPILVLADALKTVRNRVVELLSFMTP